MYIDKIVDIQGFDKNQEPEIRIYDDNHLEIVFGTLPPLKGNGIIKDSSYWNTFENILSKHLKVKVLREKNEIFIIAQPKEDTIKRLKEYLENYWFITDFF
ncbi:MAG: hypothetical protein LBE39_11920 [Flavobacteriaceae bacterium]|jgi:hypothetical protein|nr:hypothetical protein [Flavobacteriaceae bacterium]